ncbi:MAG: CoA transferase [Chloroflexi bacterium]|nr:CoA transferase [Chloroflexota bacterium]
MPDTALSHLTVVELSTRVAVSFATKFLADFGAEVIKVERPVAGAPERRFGPYKDDHVTPDGSGLHLFLNTNKKSITLDPSTTTGAMTLKELLKQADVFIEATAPGTLESWELSPGDLERANPGLIVTSVTDFGQTGPYRDYKATDMVHWAMSSLLIGSGVAGREPIRIGDDVSEYVAGLNACATTLGALIGRHRTGGQRIDLSVLESLMTVIPSNALSYSYNKTLTQRSGNRFPISIAQCKDGYVGFYTMLQHQWESFTVVLGKPELVDDPRFKTPYDRLQHANEAMAIIRPWCMARTCEEIIRSAQELRVPMVKVASAKDVAEGPQFRARNFFADVGNKETGRIVAPGRPFNLERTPWSIRSKAPGLGQHNLEIYCNRLGFSKDELVILSEQGVL